MLQDEREEMIERLQSIKLSRSGSRGGDEKRTFEATDRVHDIVDFLDTHRLGGIFFGIMRLGKDKVSGDGKEGVCCTAKVTRQCEERDVRLTEGRPEIAIGELDRVESKENSEAEEVSRVQADGLGC